VSGHKKGKAMEITLKLSIEETNAILQVLGDLPTKSGAWPLIVKIKEQAEPQVPKEPKE
jgi:hypothetical protein